MSITVLLTMLTVLFGGIAYTIGSLGNRGFWGKSNEKAYGKFVLFAAIATIAGLLAIIGWLFRFAQWAGFQL